MKASNGGTKTPMSQRPETLNETNATWSEDEEVFDMNKLRKDKAFANQANNKELKFTFDF